MTAFRSLFSVFAVSALALAGCASPPNPALQQAQANFNAAAQDPAVVRAAQPDLDKARSLLESAQSAQAEGEDAVEVTHRAYLASQQTEVARQVVRYDAADQALKSAPLDAERARVRELERELNARQTDRGVVLTLGSVLFRTGGAELTSGAQGSIDKLATYLRAHQGRSVTIDGYTDNTGSDSLNLGLSQRRADTVRGALVSRGVDPRMIVAQGHGEAAPVADNSTAEGRQMNRRVEVVVANAPAATTASGSGAGPRMMPSGTMAPLPPTTTR